MSALAQVLRLERSTFYRPPSVAQRLTVQETTDYLRISRGPVFAAVRDGSLPSVRIGRRIVILRRQLEALLGGEPPPS